MSTKCFVLSILPKSFSSNNKCKHFTHKLKMIPLLIQKTFQNCFQALVKNGTTTVLVCNGWYTLPVSTKITLSLPVETWYGYTSCFTVPAGNTNTCTALKANATFVKSGCNDQTNLKTILVSQFED